MILVFPQVIIISVHHVLSSLRLNLLNDNYWAEESTSIGALAGAVA